MTVQEAFSTPIARFVTRPSGRLEDLTSTDVTPDLIMGTLLKSSAHLLKSNTIYELVLNEMTGVIELHEKGASIIGKRWGREYHELPSFLGPKMWLTEKENMQIDGVEYDDL